MERELEKRLLRAPLHAQWTALGRAWQAWLPRSHSHQEPSLEGDRA